MAKSVPSFVLDLPVEFGGFSYGGNETCRIGIKIDRTVCNLNCADDTFCGHRLTGKLVLGHHDDAPGQKIMFEDEKVVEGVFDTKRLGLSPEQINFGATFNEKEIDVALLCSFAKQKGRLLVEVVEEIPEPEKDSDDVSDDSRILPGALSQSGPWADVNLSSLLSKSIATKLAKAKINTMGELAAYTSKEHNLLTDIAGIGPGAAGQIEEMTLAFFRDNVTE